MCLELIASTAGVGAGRLIDQLDVECEAKGAASYGLAKGPFHVFDIHAHPTDGTADERPSTSSTAASQGTASIHDGTSDDDVFPNLVPVPILGPLESTFLLPSSVDRDSAGGTVDLPEWNYTTDSPATCFYGPAPLSTQQLLTPSTGQDALLDTLAEPWLDVSLSDLLRSPSPIPRSIPQSPKVGNVELPKDASFLLHQSRELFSGDKGTSSARKSPWQLVALPSALETFAELSIFSDASHSRLASFYALLSNTAFQLERKQPLSTGSLQWRTSGLQYFQMAKLHLQRALNSEVGPTSTKSYKQLLMSLIAMATAAMYHSPRTMSAFLIDAERLIRLQGIPKQTKSFKTRLLHHVYTHLRIVFESFSRSNDSLDDEVSSPPLSDPATMVRCQLRHFRVSVESLNAGLDYSTLKLSEIGYNDLHLEVQGNWAETLFPQLYGIPESLLTLLSQTICLANDKKRLDRLAASDPVLSAAVSKHVKTLEHNIWTWSPKAEQGLRQLNSMICEPRYGFEKDPWVKTLVAAMHDAVLIYFYRRVHNVHAMMLQDLVRKIFERLTPCMLDAADPDFSTTIAWPYMVAASEAATPELQQMAFRCVSSIEARGMPFVLEDATNVAQQVWQLRQQSKDYTLSWLDVVAT